MLALELRSGSALVSSSPGLVIPFRSIPDSGSGHYKLPLLWALDKSSLISGPR